MKRLIVFILPVFLFGCAGMQTEVSTIFEDGYWDGVEPIVRSNNLDIGMDKYEVEEIMGPPTKRNEDFNPYGVYEKWVYKPIKYHDDDSWWVYLFFKDGILVNIQRPNNF